MRRNTSSYTRREKQLNSVTAEIKKYLRKIMEDLDPDNFTKKEFVESYAVYTKEHKGSGNGNEQAMATILDETEVRKLIEEIRPGSYSLTNEGRAIVERME